MTLPVGTKLGVYEILSPLDAGGMGEVYRAHDTKLQRDVAPGSDFQRCVLPFPAARQWSGRAALLTKVGYISDGKHSQWDAWDFRSGKISKT